MDTSAHRDTRGAVDPAALDERLRSVARRLAAASRPSPLDRLESLLLGGLMASQALRVGVFRLVEAYPALHGDQQTLTRIEEELGSDASPAPVRWLVRLAQRLPFGPWLARRISAAAITATAGRFIAGRDADDALAVVRALWEDGTGVVVDALGEKTVTAGESDHYVARVTELVERLGSEVGSWPAQELQERDHHGPLPRVAVAVKPTACSPHFSPHSPQRGIDEVARRLAPVLRTAAEHDVLVWFDMEQHSVKDMTHDLFRRLADEVPQAEVGIVVQAYLRDSHDDLVDLLAWARERGRPVGVRLVKGAYWDHETVVARANDWEVPVFQQKWASDANFDRLAALLNDNAAHVRPAFASHNLRSLSHALAHASLAGLPRGAVEVEVLHGMAGALPEAVRRLDVRTRVYVPVGELVPGMSYLVRRLLENTSNESFLRQQDVRGAELEQLLSPPPSLATAEPPPTDLLPSRTPAPTPTETAA